MIAKKKLMAIGFQIYCDQLIHFFLFKVRSPALRVQSPVF